MKLRNKKTGEIWEIPKMRYPTAQEDDISFFAMLGTKGELFCYRSIAQLNEEWEDYTPVEPLIKDEKIRKAVRAWAEANGVERVCIGINSKELIAKFSLEDESVSFKKSLSLGRGRNYTIAELCGEEEE